MPAQWLYRALAGLGVTRTNVSAERAPLAPQALADAVQSARLLLVNNQLSKAEAALVVLMQSNPDDADVRANLGICLYLQGDPPRASDLLQGALELNRRHAPAAKFLAACFEHTRDDSHSGEINQLAVALNPSDPEVLLVAAARDIRLGLIGQAADLINRALKISPENVLALTLFDQLSKQSTFRRELFASGEKISAARKRMEQRLLAKEKKDDLSNQELGALLGSLENSASTFATALRLAARAEQREPISALLAEQIASVYWMGGDGPGMLRMRQMAHALEPKSATFQLALNHAELMQDPKAALKTWRSLLRLIVDTRPNQHPQNIPQWHGERLGKKRLLVYQDQGVGDALLSLRLLPLLMERNIEFDLWTVPAFRRLADLVVPGASLLDAADFPDRREDYGFAVSLLGLADAFGVEHPENLTHVPLQIESAEMPALSHLGGKRIGLVYRGNPDRRDDWIRSIAPSALAPLAAMKGVSWVSLMTDKNADRALAERILPMHDPMSDVKDFLDTARLIADLDAVVAIDCSVAHLAAALGTPLWVAAPTMLDWRWQMGEKQSPWWPDAHFHRSTTPGDFSGTMKDIAAELSAFLGH